MIRRDYAAILGFSDKWFALGIVTKESLALSGATYESSDDKSSEHYRYGAFRWYLSQRRPLTPSVAEALYELGNADPEYSMGGAMMADIVDLPECPPSVIAKALASDRKHLVRKAGFKRQPSRTEQEQRNEHFGD